MGVLRWSDGDQLGHATVVTFDTLGRQIATTDALGHVSQTEYNVAGERVVSIDALGRRTEFTYDEFGRLTEAKFPKADDEPGTPAHTFKDKVGFLSHISKLR